jgi:long-subunit acyl-CoA synthetase (AMP-forming)
MTFVPDVWTPESELVTAAMKLKRKHIQTKYQILIDQMYQTLEEDQTFAGQNVKLQ